MTRNARDDGAIVIGWLTKLVVLLSLLGLLAFDAIAVGLAYFTTADRAASAARVAAQACAASKGNVQAAYDAAAARALEHADTVSTVGFTCSRDGGAVSLRYTQTATTLVLHRFAAVAGWADVTATGTGVPFR